MDDRNSREQAQGPRSRAGALCCGLRAQRVLDVTLVEPDALAITWVEPVTGTVREMKPVLSEDASEVVRLLTERVGQISSDGTSG